MEINNQAVAYIRVSSTEQKDKRNSIEEQRRMAKSYAEKNNLYLPDRNIIEETMPASKLFYTKDDSLINQDLSNRSGLNELLDMMRSNSISNLIVYSRDRLSRSLEEFIRINNYLEAHEIKLLFSRPGEYLDPDKSSTYNLFLEIVLSSIPEFEVELLSHRVKSSEKTNILNGYWAGGKLPFGYRPIKNRKKVSLQTVPYERGIVHKIYEYYNYYGLSYNEIAQKMIKEHPHINLKWSKATIQQILTNETYLGKLVYNRRRGRRNPGKYTEEEKIVSVQVNEDAEIINDICWNMSKDLRKLKADLKDAKYFNTPYLLKDKLYCGKCNLLMKPKNYGVNKRSVYRCTTVDPITGVSHNIIDTELVHRAFSCRLSELLEFKSDSDIMDYLWDQYLSAMENNCNQLADCIIDIEKRLEDNNQAKKKLTLYYIENNLKHMHLTKATDETKAESSSKGKTADKDYITRSISTLVQDQIIELNLEHDFYKEQLVIKRSDLLYLTKLPTNERADFEMKIKALCYGFTQAGASISRVLIHLLIDKVLLMNNINMESDNIDSIALHITMKPPAF